jgi:hypothetical protein
LGVLLAGRKINSNSKTDNNSKGSSKQQILPRCGRMTTKKQEQVTAKVKAKGED